MGIVSDGATDQQSVTSPWPISAYYLRGFNNRMEQHVGACRGPLLANLLSLVVGKAIDTGTHDHCSGELSVDPASVMASTRNQIHV